MLHAFSFRCSCTSNMAFVILQIKSKTPLSNPGKGRLWIENIQWLPCIIYMPLTTWTKVCFRVLLSHVERIVYTYMHAYDVVWRAVAMNLAVCVSLPWIRGGEATVSITFCVCDVKVYRHMYGYVYKIIYLLFYEIVCVDILNKRHEKISNVCNVHRSCYYSRVATPLCQFEKKTECPKFR